MSARHYPSQPMLGVSARVGRAGRVLLVRRGRAPLRDRWSFPGGLVELGETLEAAVHREVREETGVALSGVDQIGLDEVIEADADGRTLAHFVLAVFAARYGGGTARPGDDARDVAWVAPDNPEGLELTDGTRRWLAEPGL